MTQDDAFLSIPTLATVLSLYKGKLKHQEQIDNTKIITYIESSLLILVSEGVLTCLGVAMGVEPPPISCLLDAKNNKTIKILNMYLVKFYLNYYLLQ